MQTSDDISALATALSKAQTVIKQPTRNAEGQARGGKYKYADLSTVFQAITEALGANELSIAQAPVMNGEGFVLVTRLMHSSGQWIEASYPLPVNVTSQEMGSAITYGRRYSLSALLGVASEDDDDGAGASTPARQQPSPATAEMRRDTPTTGSSGDMGVCPHHNISWFQSGKMKDPAHIVEGVEGPRGGKVWCNKDDVLRDLNDAFRVAAEDRDKEQLVQDLKEAYGGKTWGTMTPTEKLEAIETLQKAPVAPPLEEGDDQPF